ncbi:Alkaline protease 1-like protein 3 [Colletotrichum sojae]|uniref:Alkaline protease 1-like protein 3 n=1 Tax=Colletotrichum sojae TaxID=2175907 RepID=A0A8H6MJ75_9PEZI|nr:Alkaline protease 1-like protein 3 [Colletotrichum sojae]
MEGTRRKYPAHVATRRPDPSPGRETPLAQRTMFPYLLRNQKPLQARTSVGGKFIVTLESDISSRDLDSHLTWVDAVHKYSLGRRDRQANTAGVDEKYKTSKLNDYSDQFDGTTRSQHSSLECFAPRHRPPFRPVG